MAGSSAAHKQQRATRERAPSRAKAKRDSALLHESLPVDVAPSDDVSSEALDDGASSSSTADTMQLCVDSLIAISIDLDLHDSVGDGDKPTNDDDGKLNDDEDDDDGTAVDPDADEIFRRAVCGLLDGVFVATRLAATSATNDLPLQRDVEPLPSAVDRHGEVRESRRKRKPSNVLAKTSDIYYSRSRASSIYGGGGAAPSVASMALSLHSSALALKLTRLSFAPDESKAKTKLLGLVSDDSAERLRTPSDMARATATASSLFNGPNEQQRRDAIVRDLEAREQQQRITRDVQRKGDVRLKLRSLADPTVSLEAEEAARSCAASRSGGASSTLRPLVLQPSTRRDGSPVRIRASRGDLRSPSLSPQLKFKPRSPQQALAHTRNTAEASAAAIATTGTAPLNADDLTFRPEDYAGLQSDVVLLERNGELLVGKNCFVVAQRQRHDLLLDLHQRRSVEPRVNVPLEPPIVLAAASSSSLSPLPTGVTATSEQQQQQQQRSRHASPTRGAAAPNSPERLRTLSALARQDALFDGVRGSFESFPKLELDPTTTPLAKGVTLQARGAGDPMHPTATAAAAAAITTATARRSSSTQLQSRPVKASGAASQQQQPMPVSRELQHRTLAAASDHAAAELRPNDALERELHGLLRSPADAPPQSQQLHEPPHRDLRRQLPSSRVSAAPADCHAGTDANSRTSTSTSTSTSSGTGTSIGRHEPAAADARLLPMPHKAPLLLQTRMRTPARHDRATRSSSSALHMLHHLERSEFDDADDSDIDLSHSSPLFSLHERMATGVELPRVKRYQREFASPSSGHVHVLRTSALTELRNKR